MPRKLSLKSKIFLLFSTFIILFTLFISYIVIFPFYTKLQENKIEYSMEISNKIKYNLEFLLTSIVNTSVLLASNAEIKTHLTGDIDDTEVVNTLLKNSVTIQEYIKGIYIISSDGNVYTSDWAVNPDLLKEKYAQLLKEEDYDSTFTNTDSDGYHIASKMKVLTYVRRIYDYREKKDYGIVIIDVNYDYIRELMAMTSINNVQKLLLVNGSGETIFTYPIQTNLDYIVSEYPDLLDQDKMILDGYVFKERSIIVSDTIKHTDWTLIFMNSTDKILSDTKNILYLILSITLLFLILSLLIAYTISARITKPLSDLAGAMKLVEEGNLSVPVTVRSNDEFGQLALTFKNMLSKLDYSINKTIEVEKQKSNMEYQVLQAQINPHFLYNTLDSIRWLASFHNVKTIEIMVTSIINLLKYNFSRKGEVVGFSEELESVKTYLQIQKYRYGDMFDVNYNISEDVSNYNTIKFILQPIVENSIFHGFEDLDSQGLITINAYVKSNFLFIEVEDNGIGISLDQLKILKEKENSDKKYSEIGIHNIDERIKFYCGDDYGVTITSIVDLGTTITIKLPLTLNQS